MIELKTTAIKQEKLLYAVLKTTKTELEHVDSRKIRNLITTHTIK